MRCEYCKEKNATKREDPYQSDINNDKSLHWICDACYHNHLMDI